MALTEVGKRIRNLRKDKKMTQAQFGKLLGISSQYVGKIEKGLSRLPIDLIAVICKETAVSADYIIFGIKDPLGNIDLLQDLSPMQIEIGMDILKKIAELINMENGNEILIKEILRQQKSA